MNQQWAVCLLVLSAAAARPAFAHPGIGIVVDRRGAVFFTDLKQVIRIAPDGTRSIAVPNVHTHELTLDESDNLYGEHLWYEGDATGRWIHRIWRLGADGRLETLATEAAFPESGSEFSFVRDRAGNMYQARPDPRAPKASPNVLVFKRAPGQTATLLAGGAAQPVDGRGSAAGFRDIRWMTTSPDGTVTLVDLDRVREVRADGTVRTRSGAIAETSWRVPFVEERHRLMGLAVDAGGSVWVANYGGRRLKRIGLDGKVSVFAESSWDWGPTGVAVTPGGDVLILEYAIRSVRVRRLSRDGREKAVYR